MSPDLFYNYNIINEESKDKCYKFDRQKNDIFALGLTFLETLTL